MFGGFANGVGEQLCNIGHDANGGLANIKELVDECENGAKDEANDPCSDRGAESLGIVLVADNGADFGIGAVAGDEGGLEFHFLDQQLVAAGLLEDVFILEKEGDFANDGRGEVGVCPVYFVDAHHDIADLLEGILRGDFVCFEEIVFCYVEVVLGGGSIDKISVVFFLVGKGFLGRRLARILQRLHTNHHCCLLRLRGPGVRVGSNSSSKSSQKSDNRSLTVFVLASDFMAMASSLGRRARADSSWASLPEAWTAAWSAPGW